MSVKRRHFSIVALLFLVISIGILWKRASYRLNLVVSAHGKEGFSIAFTPDGSAIACGGSDGTVRFWEVKAVNWWRPRRVLKTFSGNDKYVDALSFSPDGALLAVADCDGEIRVWNVTQGSQLHALPSRKENITALSWLPDNRTLAISFAPDYKTTKNGWLELWDVRSGKRQRIIQGNGGNIVVSPDGTLYVVEGVWIYKGKRPDTVHGELCRLSDGKLIRPVKDLGDDMGPVILRFSPDGKSLLAFTSSNWAKLYSTTTGKMTRIIKSGYDMRYSIPDFSADSRWVATGGSNCCWGFGNPVIVHSVRGAPVDNIIIPADWSDRWIAGLSFSPNGSLLAVSRNGVGVELFPLK